MLEEIRTTAIQYSGYFHSEIKRLLEQGKVREDNEELRVQTALESQRKKTQEVYESKGKVVNIVI